MKIVIKGGVWKNTEDEILKAGVMKYGMNAWARIASLLNRKSAKQCKARWYEWLDPAIKKTEWTREEDEKLLHLAKLMPTQWRTIAPIVGRTATQCLERYERLLDMASGADGDNDVSDARRLRPGEIDPHPESKPARPDAVDMDDDEKEMLSEARARLANTKGKKAKRKAREKQLEEARRLASLQKKRELRAAGIQVKDKRKNKGEIDYAKEVPFERRPAPGFYDVSEEKTRTKGLREEFKGMTRDELEGGKRRHEEDTKRDASKRKMGAEKDAGASAAMLLKRQLEEEEQRNLARRGKMMLPAPQVSDMELEVLAKEGANELLEGGNVATRALVGDYSTPAASFATPMRTPAPGASGLSGLSAGGAALAAAGAGGTRVMMEAQALARLQQGQTPLLGGDNQLDLSGSDFAGITPARQVEATPNPLAAAAAAKMAGRLDGATPMTGGPQPTPQRRDAFHLNAAGGIMDSARVKSALSSLPAPKGGYQLAAPEGLGDDDDDDDEAVPMEEDATDRQSRLKAEREARLARERKMRSSAVQRNLPRPTNLDGLDGLDGLDEEDAVVREMVKLIREDAQRFPAGRPIDDEAPSSVNIRHEFTYEELQAAAKLIEDEAGPVPAAFEAVFAAAWTEARETRERIESKDKDKKAKELDAVKRQIATVSAAAVKLEQKADVMLAGLKKRNAALADDINATISNIAQASIDKACYSALLEQEQRGVANRLNHARAILAAQEERERALQERYKALSRRA